MSVTSPIYFCEDHFDLPNDMENYMRYHLMGFVNKIMLKPGCLPSKFQCQSNRKRSLPSTSTSRPAVIKRQRMKLIQEALEETKFESNTDKENTTLPINIQTEVIREEHLPKTQDKCVQALVKSKYFRGKYTQTDYKSQNIATSPCKAWTTNVSTSPFKIEQHVKLVKPRASDIKRNLMDKSDSDVLISTETSFQLSSPSVQSLQFKLLSDSSSLNEEEAEIEKEREAKQALNNMCKKIEAKPHLYIGITNECYFLVDLIHTNTSIPTEHILLCLKK